MPRFVPAPGLLPGALHGLFLSVLLAPLAAAGEPGQRIPSGGESLLPEGFTLSTDGFGNWGAADAAATVVPVEGVPFKNALRVSVPTASELRYGVQLSVPTRGDVTEGDTLFMVLWVRGEAADGGALAVHARLQQNGGEANGGGYAEILPLNASTAGSLSDPSGWTQHLQSVKSPLTQPDGTHSVSIHLGGKAQTLELGGLQLLNYGPDRDRQSLPVTRTTYDGRAADAPWRAAAAARIDRHRKADLTIVVTDADGAPLPGVTVEVTMTRHAFGFGVAADADLLVMTRAQFDRYAAGGHGSYQGFTWDDVLKYRATLAANFNKVVLENDLKIGGWIVGLKNDRGRFRREWTLAALDWLKERQIEVRGHYGVWGPIDANEPWNTGWFETDERYGDKMLAYLKDFVPQIAGRVGEWDAINHIVGWGPETLGKRYGNEYYAEVIRLMRELDPSAEMWVNEGNILSGGGQDPAYRAVIDDLIRLKQPPDGAGFMAHFRDGSLTGMNRMKQVLDAYADRGLKLQLTELDYDGLNRELQADYVRDVLTLCFSHPAMDGVVQWGFWAKRHWRPDSAPWSENWDLRPVGQAYRDLVYRQWWTDVTVKTGADGTATVRGFRGDYEVRVHVGGSVGTTAARLGEGGQTVRVGP